MQKQSDGANVQWKYFITIKNGIYRKNLNFRFIYVKDICIFGKKNDFFYAYNNKLRKRKKTWQ